MLTTVGALLTSYICAQSCNGSSSALTSQVKNVQLKANCFDLICAVVRVPNPLVNLMNNPNQHSPETIERMKANSEAAKKRLARLNQEYLARQQVRKQSRSKVDAKGETFGEAVARIAREAQITI
jgi:hypothetical protein